MKDTLVTHFGFAPADVVMLSEEEGTKKPELLPTRANIEREFKHLATVSGPVGRRGGHPARRARGQQPENHRP